MQIQILTFPQPFFTVGMRYFTWQAVLVVTNYIFDLSVQRMNLQKASGLSKYSLAKMEWEALFFIESSGTL